MNAMSAAVAQPVLQMPSWPVTDTARTRLIDEIARLRSTLADLTGQGLEEGIVELPVAMGTRRLQALVHLRDRCHVVSGGSCVAIGSRVTVREADGDGTSYEIVLPGDGDPARGRISADSPLGLAVLGARPGDLVRVRAPAGGWSLTIQSVD